MRKILFVLGTQVRNYPTSEYATALINKCIWIIENCPDVEVTIDFYYINIRTKTNYIKLWNANKFYAWLDEGIVNGRPFSGLMPKRTAAYDFKECLKRKGYNIYQKKEEQTIILHDIKC